MSAAPPAAGGSSSGALRLRVGVALIIVWLVPLWALAPLVARLFHTRVVTVTTIIVVVQTVVGLLGLWLAGTQVRSIIKGRKLRQALKALWSVFIRGDVRDQSPAGTDPDVH